MSAAALEQCQLLPAPAASVSLQLPAPASQPATITTHNREEISQTETQSVTFHSSPTSHLKIKLNTELKEMFRDVIFIKLSLVFQFPVVFYEVEDKYIITIGQNYTGVGCLDLCRILNN